MMSFEEQVNDFLLIFPRAKQYTEGGFQYLFIQDVELPLGCSPEKVNVLLCPQLRDGYPSRMFLSQVVTGCPDRNWNCQNVRILDNNWFAISWMTSPDLTIKEMYYTHLNAFNNE